MTPEQITSLLKLAADLPAGDQLGCCKADALAWRIASAIHFHDQDSGLAFADLLGIGAKFRGALQTLRNYEERLASSTSQPECTA